MSVRLSPAIHRFHFHLVILMAGICLLSYSTSEAATYTVTNTNDAGGGSLRQAIIDANTNPGTDTIAFNISGGGIHTITPSSALPTITSPVVIDGTTQPGYFSTPVIELNGASAGSGAKGLNITAGTSTVKGLAINRFTGGGAAGIYISGSGGNTVARNHIGMDPAGTTALGNTRGVVIYDCPDNDIGGTGGGITLNVISGNSVDGVQVWESGSTGNRIIGNYIGTDRTGTVDNGNGLNGIVLMNAPDNTIGGNSSAYRNVISGNGTNGVAFSGTQATGNLVRYNIIGLAAGGNDPLGNDQYGVYLVNAPGNSIGGSTIGYGNIISDNDIGVMISGTSASGNLIYGNRIGTNLSAGSAVGNSHEGVRIENAPGNTIGGTSTTYGNIISGNGAGLAGDRCGVTITGSGATNNIVGANNIGTDRYGDYTIENEYEGIEITDGASNNTIGGTTTGERNIISGNGWTGIAISGEGTDNNVVMGNYIGVDRWGSSDLGNYLDGVSINGGASNNTVGGTSTGAGNVISGNGDSGIEVTSDGTNANCIQGNIVGLNVNGDATIGNDNGGIYVAWSATNTTIGGSTTNARNVVSGNSGNGIYISMNSTTGTIVKGNYIGVDPGGTVDFGNQYHGINVSGDNTTIGGTTSGERNVVSGNGSNGIYIVSSASGVIVQGNRIGTNATGTAAIGNGLRGVELHIGCTNNTIGGTTSGARNIISGNASDGVALVSNCAGNLVIGNYIGLNSTGSYSIANSGSGVLIDGSSNNTVGGNASNFRNIISGNGGSGVNIIGGTNGTVVQNNYIGTSESGTAALGNVGSGVTISGCSNNTIGGTGTWEYNKIANNLDKGVVIDGGTGNRINTNQIYSNGNLGIDLNGNGVTSNDPGDPDSGSNNLQNFPVITSVEVNGGTTDVEGTLNSNASTTYRLEFFYGSECDPTYYGEGRTFSQASTVSTNGSGNASFSVTLPVAVPDTYFVTCTATDPGGNTSEFSEAYYVMHMILTSTRGAGQADLTWTAVTPATEYWVFGETVSWYFEPDMSPSHTNRLAIIPSGTTTWSSSNGVGDDSVNWVYRVVAMGSATYELCRSNHAGEFDFDLP